MYAVIILVRLAEEPLIRIVLDDDVAAGRIRSR